MYIAFLLVLPSVVDPNWFFSDSDSDPRIFFSDSVSDSGHYTKILARNFFLMVLLFAFICVLESVRQRKSTYVFFLSNVWSTIFHTIFRIQIRTFFGFGFWSSQNIRILSDSDPQHWHCCHLLTNKSRTPIPITGKMREAPIVKFYRIRTILERVLFECVEKLVEIFDA
jgi:hypothetical protein